MKAAQTPPRILILLENHVYPRDVRVRPQAEALAESGYEVTVASPGGKGSKRREVIHGVQVYRYPAAFAQRSEAGYLVEYLAAAFFLTILTLWIWMRHGLDVLLLYNPPDILWLAGLIPKAAGKTIVLDIRDHAPELYQSKFQQGNAMLHRALLWMEYRSCRMADHIIVTNETSCRLVQERNGVRRERISVIRQGPDTEKIRPTAPDPLLRSRARVIIGYLGSMAQERGVGTLLQALAHLERAYGLRDWLCVLAGRVDASLDVEALAAKLGIGERVWLAGFLPEEQWVRVFSTTDLCVDPGPANPINAISTTNKMMDYMALGKAVVAFDMPERRATAGEAALYARTGEAADLAQQMAQLIESPDLRDKLGKAGRERVERLLAWRYQKERFLALFSCLTQWGADECGKTRSERP